MQSGAFKGSLGRPRVSAAEGHWTHSRAVWHPRRVRGGMRFCGVGARSGPRFAATAVPPDAADYASL
jgi:hypothetical protein